MKAVAHIVIAILLVVMPAACSSDGCLENQSSIPLAGLYSGADSAAISLDVISVRGIGAPDDSVLYTAGTTLSKLYLPMRSTHTSTSWEISYDLGEEYQSVPSDTITFDYTSSPYFVSDQCGVIYNYRITNVSYTTYLLKGVSVTDSLVTNTDVERIKIYFKVQTQDDSGDTDDSEENDEDDNAPVVDGEDEQQAREALKKINK